MGGTDAVSGILTGTGRVSVLYVDDDEAFGDLVATRLERADEGFDVDVVADAAAALSAVEDARYDCVVSDYDMPQRDGLELLRTLRDRGVDLPFVLFTGNGSEELASEAIAAGVDGYLRKSGSADRFDVLANRVRTGVRKRRAERSHRELFERAADAMAIVDPRDGRVLAVNERFSELLGYGDGAAPFDVGRVSADASPYTPARFTEHVRDGADEPTEWLCETADGDLIWTEVALRTGPIGGEERIVASFRDVTDRKQGEHELKRQTQRVETVHDVARELDGLDDVEAVATTVVEGVQTVTDCVGCEFRREGGAVATMGSVPTDAEVRDALGDVDGRCHVESETAEAVAVSVDDDDSIVVYVEDRLEDDAVELVDLLASHAGTALDRLERGQRLERRDAQRTALSQAFPDYAFVYDDEGRYTDVFLGFDDREETMFDPEDLMGERVDDVLPADVGPTVLELIQGALRDDEVKSAEYAIDTPGGVYWYEGRAAPLPESLRTDDAAVVLVARDVTTRHAYREELEKRTDQLEEFAEVVSHDLRNPLNLALGRLELAREDSTGGEEHFAAMADALTRMEDLVDDLLTAAREQQSEPELAPVAVRELLDHAWEGVEDGDLVVEGDLPTVSADRESLIRLLENLLRNAAEHGAGEDAPVTVRVGPLPDEAGFYVADDGPGIPAEDRDLVFESGYSTSESGTGFGLDIVASVVDAHDWTVDVVESETGGARFEISGVDVV